MSLSSTPSHTLKPYETHREVEIERVRMLFLGAHQPFKRESSQAKVSLFGSEVLVRMTLASVCGSDLHTYEGRRSSYLPSVLGHEGVGVVEAVGPEGDESMVGKRVTWTLTDTCGCCSACTDWDIPQKCESLFKYGHAELEGGSGLNGCFASHIVLREGTKIVELPEKLPDSYAVPANCALATMVAVVEEIPASVEKVLIQGGGLLGIYGVALLKARGVNQVVVTDPVPERLELAKEFGAEVLDANEMSGLEPQIFDAIIEVAGVSSVVPDGLRVLRPGGVYVFAGMVHEQTELDVLGVDIVKGCFKIIGVHNYGARHLEKAVQFLSEHQNDFPYDKLVSPALPLSKLDDAFALTLERKWHRVAVQPD